MGSLRGSECRMGEMTKTEVGTPGVKQGTEWRLASELAPDIAWGQHQGPITPRQALSTI